MQPSWRRRQQTAGVKAATNSIGGGRGKPVWLGRQQSLRRGQRLIKWRVSRQEAAAAKVTFVMTGSWRWGRQGSDNE
ncbi:hypothetical protein U1Q18_049436 [Sarracenia purpurea var. burkii]